MLFWRNRHKVRDEELNAFVDGELDESARPRVERHIASCAPCSAAVAELQAVSRAMSELPAVPAPHSFALREADVTPEPASGGMGVFGSATPLLSGVAAIAVVAFVVLAGIDIGSTTMQSDGSDESSAAGVMESQFSATDRSFAEDGEAVAENVAPAVGDDDTLPPLADDATRDNGAAVESDSETASGSDPEAPADLPAPRSEIEDDTLAFEQGVDYGAGNGPSPLVDDDGDSTGLRVAESVAAAVAIAAGGSVLLIWWRRRATAG